MHDPKTQKRVLALSSHFPTPGYPTRGVWVRRLVQASAKVARPIVVVPVPWLPPLIHSEQRARLRNIPRAHREVGYFVHYPRTFYMAAQIFRSFEARMHYPTIQRLVDCIQRQEPIDLIHAHFIYPEGVIAARLGRRYGIPVVTTEHANWLPWLDRELSVRKQVVDSLGEIARVVAVSPQSAETIREVAGNRVQIDVMPNAVDDAVFELNPAFVRDPNRILFAGMIRQVKGVDVLVRAMNQVVQKRPDTYVEIVGDPYFPSYRREADSVRKLAQELGLARQIRFMGPLDSPDLARRISESALVVLPSRRESFGSVLIESLACGTPVVSTRCGGPEGIVNEAVGRLAAINDPDDLAASLLDVLANPDRFDPVALNSYAVERYGLAAVGRQLGELYAEVAGR